MPPTDIQSRPPAEQGDTGLGEANYDTGRLQLSPQIFGTPLLGLILRHELTHMLQNRMMGSRPNPVDTAIRQRAGIPQGPGQVTNDLNEGLAQFVENPRASQDTTNPLIMMAIRAILSQIMGGALRGQQPQAPQAPQLPQLPQQGGNQ
jgi:hypothetical protein